MSRDYWEEPDGPLMVFREKLVGVETLAAADEIVASGGRLTVETLAGACGCSVAAARTRVKRLVAAGLMAHEVERTSKGRHRPLLPVEESLLAHAGRLADPEGLVSYRELRAACGVGTAEMANRVSYLQYLDLWPYRNMRTPARTDEEAIPPECNDELEARIEAATLARIAEDRPHLAPAPALSTAAEECRAYLREWRGVRRRQRDFDWASFVNREQRS